MIPQLEPEHLRILSNSPLFRDMEPDILEDIFACPGCTLQHFSAGVPVYQPDRFLRCLGIVLSGQIKVTKPPLTVSVLNTGSLFGAAALYNEEPDYATTLTTLRTEVDNPICNTYHIEVVLDDDGRITTVNQAVDDIQQLAYILEMEARSRLIKDVECATRIALR